MHSGSPLLLPTDSPAWRRSSFHRGRRLPLVAVVAQRNVRARPVRTNTPEIISREHLDESISREFQKKSTQPRPPKCSCGLPVPVLLGARPQVTRAEPALALPTIGEILHAGAACLAKEAVALDRHIVDLQLALQVVLHREATPLVSR